ncbi:hypothetical protein BST91_05205 [Nonlabens tegetincola]|uniref:hypothetical protein n=1 Tax=Nonlabens tegetincola TaxID=323273 RepID=UPI000A20A564|nr:hypothetical protein [Nonlabens tegetincola]ARN71090.1 hypothetical protein BST91_05205 [Nonlabens tegetincola]
MKILLTLILLLFFGIYNVFAQSIYKVNLGNCNTQRFALESVDKIAEIENQELIKSVAKLITPEQRKKIRGILKLQIIVYKEGNSCLLSYENETNINSLELDFDKFKDFIDSNLEWKNGKQNVAALIEIKFKRKKLKFLDLE